MEKCWILIGMMGAGKSSVGRAIAEISGREFIDTDLLLQHKLGRPIPQLFQIYGEDAFRDHESSILRSLQPSSSVLSTGGGIVIREENWTQLNRLGVPIYLRAQPETLIARLQASKKRRPLLEVEDWPIRVRELLEKRESQYLRAEVIVDMDGENVESAAKKVLDRLGWSPT